ncbi:MAG: gamma-glutamyltransferase [Chloroflexota bacterium]|nr:gamma-glutamyltransferase [Chloroflexota bacterium]
MTSLNREQVMTQELRADVRVSSDSPPRDLTMARRGMVASAHQLVSETAIDVMRHGGNAIDAAIAGAAMLMVVEPRNGHLGGDTFMLFHHPSEGRMIALNGSGAAPLAATVERYRELDGFPEDGLLTSTVPGTLACWNHALRHYGTKPLAELLEPAISYAEEGVPVSVRLHRMLSLDAPTYRKFPDSANIFLPDGDVPAIGSLFRQPALARTLRRITSDGVEDFYNGALAREMIAASETYGGIFSTDDFVRHETEEATPLSIDYRGYTVYEQPPVSQGIIVLLALNILKQFDLASYGPGSPMVVHLQIEALKLAFEDRFRHLGDPRFVDIPVAHLLSDKHAAEQTRRIDLDRVTHHSLAPVSHPDTTYMCVADGSGMMVSYIHSLFSGAGVVLGETGVLMNSRLLGFSLDDGDPNQLAPGKRPVHTLNNYLVEKDGHPVLVGGTPGAHWQVQTNLQMLVNALDFGMDPQAAIEAPRFIIGDQLSVGDPTVKLESRYGDETIEALRRLGHQIEVTEPWGSAGSVQLIARDPVTGLLRGATEVRRAGTSVLGF